MLSLVIPFYNCEELVHNTVTKVIKYREKYMPSIEFIAINDGSSDNTLTELKKFENSGVRVVSYDKNIGKGGAIREGVMAAKGNVIIFTDADLAYGLEPVSQFAKEMKTADIVIGTRRHDKNIARSYGFVRLMSSKAFSFITEKFLHLEIEDTQCGFKAFRADVAKELFLNLETNRFGFDIEILCKAKKQGLKIIQVPVKLITNEYKTNVNLIKDGTKMLFEIIRLRNQEKGESP